MYDSKYKLITTILTCLVFIISFFTGCKYQTTTNGSLLNIYSTVLTDTVNVIHTSDKIGDSSVSYTPADEPDLIVESITYTPSDPSKGDSVTIDVKIKNQGNHIAFPCRIDLYIDGSFKNDKEIGSIEAGSVIDSTFKWVAEAGSHTVKIIVDTEFQIIESNESNNMKEITVSVLPPDLIIQDVDWAPVDVSEGDNVTFTVIIKNQGIGDADYASVALNIDGIILGYTIIGVMNSGSTDNKTLNWTAEAGIQNIKVVLDPYNRLVESNENNNDITVDLASFLPDLIASDVTWLPTNPSVGEEVTFTVTITNQGIAGSTSSSFDYYIGDYSSGSKYLEGIDTAGSITKTITWKAKVGSHDLRIIVDPDREVQEISEVNNDIIFTFAGTISPDLVIQKLWWLPEEPSVGEVISFWAVIKNQGEGNANNSHYECYINDMEFTTGYLGALSAGSTCNITFDWVVEDGLHNIIVVADSNDEVPESNEENNKKLIIYPEPPDLKIEEISWSPLDISENETLTFIVAVKNQGKSKSSGTHVQYYIDDIALVFMSVSSIEPGSTENHTVTWVAKEGAHIIKLVIDPDNNLVESNEFNNQRFATFSVSALSSSTDLPATPSSATATQDSSTYKPEPVYVPGKHSITDIMMFCLAGVTLAALMLLGFTEYKRRKSGNE
ncbi:CARDB domain-containing protein [Chloroflexota bacterium]